MLTEKEVQRIIKELEDLETLGKQIQQRSCNTKALLERFYAPASKGEKKAVIPEEVLQAARLRMQNKMLTPRKPKNQKA